ncbi:hypothetical protein M8818_006520 [Zalaria obscura]|uniref:Uncharacterized protein n=1 Tax=Zalaria obscura TaxID=2024903 RepID=A0ACC3S6P6_9PEZI
MQQATSPPIYHVEGRERHTPGDVLQITARGLLFERRAYLLLRRHSPLACMKSDEITPQVDGA